MTKRVNRPHLKRGRPAKQPGPDTARRIRHLAATGHSVIGIARGLNVSHVVLSRWLDEYPAIREALNQGRAEEEFALHNVLFRAAMKGNVVAAIYLTKARFGWREGDQTDTANKVSITFSLPGALKPEEFNVIEHEPNTNLPVPATRISRS